MAVDKKIQGELEKKLIQEKKDIENELAHFAKPTGIPGDYATKFNDIGTDIDENASEVEEYTDNLALERSLEEHLKKVSYALAKLGAGGYGKCESCGREIEIDRLRAYPAAKRCVKCKQEARGG
jgi:RNA polymerase-binding transcription factor DksA